jgi:uncharacterized membrane protein YebE (DUF533 family)
MVWLVLLTAFQVLGGAIALTRLAYDEWQQWRASRREKAAGAGSTRMEYEPWRATATM